MVVIYYGTSSTLGIEPRATFILDKVPTLSNSLSPCTDFFVLFPIGEASYQKFTDMEQHEFIFL